MARGRQYNPSRRLALAARSAASRFRSSFITCPMDGHSQQLVVPSQTQVGHTDSCSLSPARCFAVHSRSLQEPNNLKNRNNFRFNGLIHPKVVGVEVAAKGKGVVFSTGNVKSRRLACARRPTRPGSFRHAQASETFPSNDPDQGLASHADQHSTNHPPKTLSQRS